MGGRPLRRRCIHPSHPDYALQRVMRDAHARRHPATAAPPPASPTPYSPTASPTAPPATSTAGLPTTSPTPCVIQFTDVPSSNPFYPYVRCLACRGIVSGYADGTFRPGAAVTRGQLA